MSERLSLREKARRRDGDGAHLRPRPGIFRTALILPNGLKLELVRVKPREAGL